MSEHAKQRALERIAGLARDHLDLATFWRESTGVISRALPNYEGPCWYTLDPASLLVTSHFNEYMPELPSEAFAHEYYGDDVNKLSDVARSKRGVATLHEATGGDPTRSPRWHWNMQYGGDQEMIAALRTRAGDVWGAVGIYREKGQPLFDDQDLRFVQEVAPHLAEERAADSSWARRRTLRDPMLQGWSCSHIGGKWSRPRPGSSTGSRTCPTGTGRRAGCRRR
jgi:hypothetical protein